MIVVVCVEECVDGFEFCVLCFVVCLICCVVFDGDDFVVVCECVFVWDFLFV